MKAKDLKIRVYIASPYTKGDSYENVRKSIDVFKELLDLGLIPFSPLAISSVVHFVYPIDYEKWMEFDFEWVKQCHCLLRVPGESSGADREVEVAKENGIPVYYSIGELMKELDAPLKKKA